MESYFSYFFNERGINTTNCTTKSVKSLRRNGDAKTRQLWVDQVRWISIQAATFSRVQYKWHKHTLTRIYLSLWCFCFFNYWVLWPFCTYVLTYLYLFYIYQSKRSLVVCLHFLEKDPLFSKSVHFFKSLTFTDNEIMYIHAYIYFLMKNLKGQHIFRH